MALTSSLNQSGAIPRNLTQGQSYTDPGGRTGIVNFDTATGKPLAQGGTTSTIPVQQGTNPGMLQQPTTAVKSISSPDGSTTTYHAPITKPANDPSNAYNTDTGVKNPNYIDPNAPKPAPAPQISTQPAQQAQNVSQAGAQTPNELATQQRLIQLSQAPSQDYLNSQSAIQQNLEQQKQLQQNFATQNKNIDLSGVDLSLATGQEGVLGRLYAAKQAALTNQGAGLSSQLAAANTQQGLQGTAGQNAYAGAQNQAARGLGAQQGVLNASLPTQVSPTNVPFSQLTGQYGTPASQAYGQGGLAGVGAILQQQQQGADTQTMIGAFNQAKPLIESAKQQIQSSGFNISPVALVNKLQQYVNSNVIPSGEFANIFNTLSEIATTISPVLGAQGAQTDLKTMIAQNFIPQLLQGKDIGSVLDTIENNALLKINANKSSATGTPLNVPQGSPATGTSNAPAGFGWNG